jgi:hypothetical protein
MNNDMSKCSNKECPLKENCKRWTYVSTSERQSYNHYIPETPTSCTNQIKIKQNEIISFNANQ